MMRVTKLLALVVPLLFAAQAFGQTGKIAGRVIDAGTGDGLPGVNVSIEGTTVGTVTDVEGYYTIINVRPATYSIRASFVGFTPEILENLRVSTGLTTEADFDLREQIVEGDELVVTAERPIVQLDVSANVASLNPAEFVDLPVAGVSEVIDLQAGIEPGLQIRGGGSNEIAFVVDGMNLRTGRHQSPFTAIAYTALEEVQVQTGGFNAEYGNVRSGVVNVTTKEPSRTRYTFDGMFRFAPVQDKALNPLGLLPDQADCGFGTDKVDPSCDSWFVRGPYDPETAFGGTQVWDKYTQLQYREFEGWNSMAEKQQGQGFDVTPQDLFEYFKYTKRKDNRIDHPDYQADVTIGGPLVPGMAGKMGDIRFLLSYRGTQTAYLLPGARDTYNSNTFTGKIVMNPRPNMRLAINGMSSAERSIAPNGDDTEVTGYSGWISTYPWGGNVFSVATNSIRGRVEYSDAYTGTGDIDHWMLGGTFTHSINANTFYEVTLQNLATAYQSHNPQLRDATYICPASGVSTDGELCSPNEARARLFTDNFGTLKPEYADRVGVDQDGDGYIDVTCFGGASDINGDGEARPYCVGEEPFGWGAIGGNLLTGESTGGHWNKMRDSTKTSVFSGRFDLTSQVNRFFQLKTGAELIISDYAVNSRRINVDLGGQPEDQIWDRTPIQGAAYAQSKLEFQGMIANIGLRLDYMDPNTEWWVPENVYDGAFRGQIEDLDEQLPKAEPDAQVYVSPRLGISFPITENSKLYFNYGHFRQQLEASDLFGYNVTPAGGINQLGNPDHPMPKTVAYELGFDQNVLDRFLLRISGFYRDIRQQTRSVVFESLGGVVNYSSRRPWNYEDVRGFEVSLNKTSGKWVRGFLNYTYLQRKSGNFGYANFYESTFDMIRYLDTSTDYRIDAPIASPFARANIIFLSPSDGNPILADWRISLLGEWRQGQSFTWASNGTFPELQDNVRWRNYKNWELRFTKHVVSPLGDLQLFLDIDNVFNRKHLYNSGAFGSDGDMNFDRSRYFWSLHLPEDLFDGLNEIEADDPFTEKLSHTPYLWIPGGDNPGDFRAPGVDYQPMEAVQSLSTETAPNETAWYWAADTDSYSRWNGSGWEAVPQADIDQALADKAYIDMPNKRYKTFLNPRRFTIGVRISI